MAKKNDALATWDAELAEAAKVEAAMTADIGGGGGGFISTRGGVLSMDGAPVPGNQIGAVVVAFKKVNAYYESEFDADNPQSPTCYAFGDEQKTMVPHDEAPDKQSPGCADCEKNQFGSAEKGRGKACKNTVRVALLAAGDFGPQGEGKFRFDGDPDTYASGTIKYMNLPVLSGKPFAAFADGLKTNHSALGSKSPLPTFAVAVRIKPQPDPKAQYVITFVPIQMVTPQVGLAVRARVAEAQKELVRPYQAAAEQAPKGKGRGAASKGGRQARY